MKIFSAFSLWKITHENFILCLVVNIDRF